MSLTDLTHDEAAEYLIEDSAGQVGNTEQTVLLLASIAHSLCALNEKLQSAMNEDS